jgi:tetratricopeptide (TPR) repeat protein
MIMKSGHALSARFVLVRPLGQSARGEVWLAEDRELGGHVALKLLAGRVAGNPVLVDSLARECERLRSLVHPNIVRVDGFHRGAGQAWIAMEYLAGGDLTQYRGRPAYEVLHAAIPVADALAYAHAAGIVHRDVKATNVLMSIDGSPRLGDFGLALALEQSPDPALGAGSPYSMSPQQWRGAPAQPADDVYAFGVLLYELLSGYPPFYPDIDVAKVEGQPVPPLAPRYPVSDDVTALVHRCLAKDPAQRPAMAAIAAGLREALEAERNRMAGPRAAAAPVLTPPPVAEVPLQAKWQRTAATNAGPTPTELRNEGFRKGLTAAALVLLIAAAGVVFFVLPNRVATPPPVVAAAPAPVPEVVDKALTPAELEALAVLKQQADDVVATLTPRVNALKEKAVDQWATEPWAALQAGILAAGASYAVRDYAAATSGYEAAAKSVAELEGRMGDVLKDALARGAAALDSGNASAAREAYALASKLAPGQQQAARGLRRAESLDAVMALIVQADADEKEGRLTAAAETFGRAAKLDPDTRRATDGLARVQARLSGDAFAAAMAGGFTAMTARDYAGARKAFELARSLRGQAPEVQQALQQLEQEERTATIASRLASARSHEVAERWQQALADYQAIVALDATVAAAQQGIERTGPRVTLNDELQLYVTQPERLFSAPVRDSATVTLNRAKGVSPAGPVLAKQIATLDEWLKRVSVPVQVALESDNLTQVTIYRVGELGPFTRKAVELTPGKYTVVGTRPGFRDVRREITVVPGAAPAPVVIRCEDRI